MNFTTDAHTLLPSIRILYKYVDFNDISDGVTCITSLLKPHNSFRSYNYHPSSVNCCEASGASEAAHYLSLTFPLRGICVVRYYRIAKSILWTLFVAMVEFYGVPTDQRLSTRRRTRRLLGLFGKVFTCFFFLYFSLVGVLIKVIVILAIYREYYSVLLWCNSSDILAWKSQTSYVSILKAFEYYTWWRNHFFGLFGRSSPFSND